MKGKIDLDTQVFRGQTRNISGPVSREEGTIFVRALDREYIISYYSFQTKQKFAALILFSFKFFFVNYKQSLDTLKSLYMKKLNTLTQALAKRICICIVLKSIARHNKIYRLFLMLSF